ncbi:MAG: LCP family protein [Candidatus Shapirobacteria bacterium]|nr:LCP family protein [Candidatus Shapirobacteria bacterium]
MPKIVKITIISVLLLIGLSFGTFYYSVNLFAKKLNQSPENITNFVREITQSNPYKTQDKVNFMVLGLDKRDDSLEKTETTDTIIFASLNRKDNKINLISIPRDLWFYDLNVKVNEVYPLSLKETDKISFIKDKFQKLTGQKIDHVLVLTTDNLIQFVNLIGGVDVTLEKGFIDKQYPNPDYIKDPKSGAPIYKTVEFQAGQIHLDQSNITEFVRSRHGGETAAQSGTDLARIQRQQLVIQAVLDKIKTGTFINNPSQISSLYRLWNENITKDISDSQIVQIITSLGQNITKTSLNKIEIKVGTSAKDGLIYHPASFINKQWVFIPSDKDYKSFQQFFSDSI